MGKHQGTWDGIEYESAGDLAVKLINRIDIAEYYDRNVITDIFTYSNPADSRIISIDTNDDSGGISIRDFGEEFEHASVFCLIKAVRGPRDTTQFHGYRLTGIEMIQYIEMALESGEFHVSDSGVLTERAENAVAQQEDG